MFAEMKKYKKIIFKSNTFFMLARICVYFKDKRVHWRMQMFPVVEEYVACPCLLYLSLEFKSSQVKVKEFIVAYTKLLQRSEILKTWPATSTQ